MLVSKIKSDKMEIRYTSPLPENKGIAIIANEPYQFGTIDFISNYPRKHRIWANAQMVHTKGLPKYLEKNVLNSNSLLIRKIISIFLTPVLTSVMRSLEIIPVYRDMRLRETLAKTNETLISGKDVIIYPETNNDLKKYNYIKEIQDGFVLSAKYYYKETGRRLEFFPAYICNSLNIISVGKPVKYNPQNTPRKERERIANYATKEIERLALELPEHKISRNKWLMN